MLTREGASVLEFNARFGDPETQVLLPRLQSDLLALLAAVAHGRLDSVPEPRWTTDASCGVVVASAGYPGAFARGHEIHGLDTLDPPILVFHPHPRTDPAP